MADSDVATKAPESDAAVQSPIPGDTVAQEGASMGVCTFLNKVFPFLTVDRSIAQPIGLPVCSSFRNLYLSANYPTAAGEVPTGVGETLSLSCCHR